MESSLSNLTRGDSYRLATSARPDNARRASQQRRQNLNNLKQELDVYAHRISIHELYEELNTDPNQGLTSEEAADLLKQNGLNRLTPVYSTPSWILFLRNLFGGLNLLLWIAFFLCIIAFGIQGGSYSSVDIPLDNLYLAIVLIVIIFLSTIFLFYQERKSMKIMEKFEKIVPYKARVIRNGYSYEIPAEGLVVGDIVLVKNGDRIPADIRIIEASSFKVDNSALTGESDAQVRTTDYTNENSLETKNLAFFSTNAVEGSCKGVVINTGDSTVIGRIANLASTLELKMTPIAKEINFFVWIIGGISGIIGFICLIVAFSMGYFWIDSIMLLIAVIIACIPEGLMATVTVCLTLTAQRMSKKNCLVKHLEAVETLGCTQVICCDKTGTLTQNRMSITHALYDSGLHDVDLTSDEFVTTIDIEEPSWQILARDAMLCNHSVFMASEDDSDKISEKNCTGDSSEAAIFRFTEIAIGNVEEYRSQYPKAYELPFNSENKYQITIHQTSGVQNSNYLMIVKGAPEKVITMCNTIIDKGQLYNISQQSVDNLSEYYEELGEMGERVIAYAEKQLDGRKFPGGFPFEEEEKSITLKNMTFVGLLSMKDPPRPSVPQAIQKCRQAGIKVVMITGDHPITAKAIAKDVGIISEYNKTVEDLAKERGIPISAIDPDEAKACVVHGSQLVDLSDDQLDRIMSRHMEIVFARSTPHQKLAIVESLQRLGYVVAVTGDGVNDSPALKKADIGISMGISGSDVSKESADMILMDDNFASIVDGVEEGRLIFENLKKALCYMLTSNIPEFCGILFFFIFSIPLPLSAITILLIDLGTDVFCAISLAYEEAETDIMQQPPRDLATDRLVSSHLLVMAFAFNGLIEAAAGFFAYIIVMTENGFWPLRLILLRQQWDSPAINDVLDSYGQEWSYTERKKLEYVGYAAFFVAIVMTQWINLLMCKTRRNSIFSQGMKNHYLTGSLFVSAALAIIFVYVPGLNFALRLEHLRFTWWLLPLPFMILQFLFNEIFKLIMRRKSSKQKSNKGFKAIQDDEMEMHPYA